MRVKYGKNFGLENYFLTIKVFKTFDKKIIERS